MTAGLRQDQPRFAVCVSNEGYAASLMPRRLYEVLPDREAFQKGLLRVIDDSGEDYLFPASMFEEIDLPKLIQDKLRFH
jgi:hypothetical protein